MAKGMRVVIAARKGGAGKTTVSVLLARELARQGARVLVLDLDGQRVGSGIRLGADVTSPLRFTAMDLALGEANGGRPFAVQTVIPGHLDVIPANQADLAAFERRLAIMFEDLKLLSERPRRAVLDVRLADIATEYDFVLIDTPTFFGEITTSALEAADIVLSPIDMQSADNVESARDLLEHLEEVQRKPVVRFVANKYTRNNLQCSSSLTRAQELCGNLLLHGILLPASTAVPQAMSEHRELRHNGDSAVLFAQRMWMLAQFVMGQAPVALPAPAVAAGGEA